MGKVKIIEFFGEPLNYGGQEAFILNVYSKINKENFEFTFITPFECKNIKLKEMVKKNGDQIIVDNQLFESKLRKKSIINTAKKYLNNKYDVIHIHSGSLFTLYYIAKIAKKVGIKKVIIHSHATGKKNWKYRLIKLISDQNIEKYVDHYLACSNEAAKFKFPKKIIKENLYNIIKNGIDLQKYKFSEKTRIDYRKMLNISDNDILLGNIGRLSQEKNQLFIIKILKELRKKNNNYKLLLIGDGPLKEKIDTKIKELNLNESVIILDKRDDIYALLMSMDIFIFPSLYEGFGLALIEAEKIGLPTICSNNIPKETIVNNNCICMKDFNINDWINEIEKINLNKEINDKNFQLYSIENTVKEIYYIYNK